MVEFLGRYYEGAVGATEEYDLMMLLTLCTLSIGLASAAVASVPPLQATPPGLEAPQSLSGLPPEDVRTKAAVTLPGWGAAGYSGFFTTNAIKSNHMFYWFFPNPGKPLLIWLQGGPGGSSMFGLFAEMGPFNSNAELKLVKRNASWTSRYAMLFIDNPVGAGFSYTTSDDGYCDDSKQCVASNLYSLLQQFYAAFPDQLKVELFITGESYGGHYVPAISAYIHKQNLAIRQSGTAVLTRWNAAHAWGAPAVSIPLGGMAIGDGWIDPVNMVPAYPAMLYNMGLCDERERAVIQDYCDRTVAFIKAGKMLDAFNVWDEFLNGDVWPYGNYVRSGART